MSCTWCCAGSGDEALAEAERTCSAAAALGASAGAAAQLPAAKCARVLVWHAPAAARYGFGGAGGASAAFGANAGHHSGNAGSSAGSADDFAAVDTDSDDIYQQPLLGPQKPGGSSGGLLQEPSREVQYDAVHAAAAGGVPTAAAQLAAEKAALKQQLRQLDTDFEVRLETEEPHEIDCNKKRDRGDKRRTAPAGH